MKKEKLQQQAQSPAQPTLWRSNSADESRDPSDYVRSNGYSSEVSLSSSNSKKSFASIDKEIEQLAQFESKAKKKPTASSVPGQALSGKLETKLSLNQIKVHQQQRERVVPMETPPVVSVTTPGSSTRVAPQAVTQTSVPQQSMNTFTGAMNPGFSNSLSQSQSAQVPATTYSGAVVNGPWAASVEHQQWAVGEPQPGWTTEGTPWAVPVCPGSNAGGPWMPQPFLTGTNVTGPSFVVQTAPHQKMPHR